MWNKISTYWRWFRFKKSFNNITIFFFKKFIFHSLYIPTPPNKWFPFRFMKRNIRVCAITLILRSTHFRFAIVLKMIVWILFSNDNQLMDYFAVCKQGELLGCEFINIVCHHRPLPLYVFARHMLVYIDFDWYYFSLTFSITFSTPPLLPHSRFQNEPYFPSVFLCHVSLAAMNYTSLERNQVHSPCTGFFFYWTFPPEVLLWGFNKKRWEEKENAGTRGSRETGIKRWYNFCYENALEENIRPSGHHDSWPQTFKNDLARHYYKMLSPVQLGCQSSFSCSSSGFTRVRQPTRRIWWNRD